MALCLIFATFGLLAALIAFERGRSPLGWFLGGFLVGPLALLVSALPARASPGRFVQCRACLGIVREHAQVCRHCGTGLD